MRANPETDKRLRKWSERDKMIARMFAKDRTKSKAAYVKALGTSKEKAEDLLQELGLTWKSAYTNAKRSSS